MAVNACPPSYSPASSSSSLDALPSYSRCPHASECTIASSPYTQSALPTGSVVRRGKHATVALHNQDSDASIPQYGKRGIVAGEIALEHSAAVLAVSVKLQASMSTSTQAGSRSSPILRKTVCLYKRTRCSCPSVPSSCPGIVPFSIDLPATFRHHELNQDFPLPPSLKLSHYEDRAGLFYADVEYSVLVSITRRVSVLGLKFTSSVHGIRIPINYAPKSRPASPAIDLALRGSLKCHPDEWSQKSSELHNTTPELGSIQFDFFTPSVRVFSVGQPIRFHLLACGTLPAMRDLWQLTSTSTPQPRPSLRVTLMRQYVAESLGGKGVHNVDLGEAELFSLPPSIDSVCKVAGIACLYWEGVVRFTCTKTVGTFNVGNLQAKDFLAVSFCPNSAQSKLSSHKFHVPVRLVSDAWQPPAGYAYGPLSLP